MYTYALFVTVCSLKVSATVGTLGVSDNVHTGTGSVPVLTVLVSLKFVQ